MDIFAKTNGRKDCTTAIVRVETSLKCQLSAFDFVFECGHQYAAELLTKQINLDITEHLQQIRRFAYTAGYAHGRAHRRQVPEFSSTWNSSSVEG